MFMAQAQLEPTGLESILIDVAIIGVLVAAIVTGIIALRNRRR
jgi:subtilase family serine protease